MKSVRQALEEAKIDLGFSAIGVAPAIPILEAVGAYEAWLEAGAHADMAYLERHREAKRAPQNLLPGARSIIAVALNYNQPNQAAPGEARIARYALGRDYHRVLGGKLRKLEARLREIAPEAKFRACVDAQPLLERSYAHLAGLGWFGKNTMLIDSRRGSWFVLGFLLTTLEIPPDRPSIGGCGTCRACIDACPTGAIVQIGGRWGVDSRRCISYQTIERRGPLETPTHGWTFGCDICQEVCPFNEPRETQPERAPLTTEPDFLAKRSWPSLVELAQISEERWDALSKGSPVRRAGLEGIRRNAAQNFEDESPDKAN